LNEKIITIKKDIGDMNSVIERLEKDNSDQLILHQQLHQEMIDLNNALKEEEESKKKLEIEILNLRQQLLGKTGNMNVIQTPQDVVSNNEIEIPFKQLTRIEREFEVLALRKELERQKQETEMLKQISDRAKDEVSKIMEVKTQSGDGKVPEWIKQLNNYAAMSQTIRIKTKKQGQVSGENMTFQEKMLLFTANQHNDDNLKQIMKTSMIQKK
jgi:hypothetical protein